MKCIAPCLLLLMLYSCGTSYDYPFQDPENSFDDRADDMVSRMNLEEKVGQMLNDAAAIPHLGVPEYNWWNECLHGVARAGRATVFPQAIAMAATFDRDLVFRMADITSTEARAKYNDFQARGKRGIYQGLTFWSPNINIFRDPRWGRGHETYGEDPYLTGEIGVSFIRGLQGEHPRYLKVVATSKHYVVHSGPESLRHEFDAVVGVRDFRDTYLPAFRKTVIEGEVYSVMCAYNRYLGEPCCGSRALQEELLRGELGFEGYIVSDCGAIRDFHTGHGVAGTREEAAALGVLSGTDLNCGSQFFGLTGAVKQGLITGEQIGTSVRRLMLARMKLGMFDPPEMVPWSDLTTDTVACETHHLVALEMARKSVVLLRNENARLPLDRNTRKIAVIGPNADNVDVQYGNYSGTPVSPVSVLEGIRREAGNDAEVRYALGSPHHEGLPYLVRVQGEVLFRDPDMTEPGTEARSYANLHGTGEPVSMLIDTVIDHYWWDGEMPAEGLANDGFSIVWSGYLVPRRSGTHAVGVDGKFFKFVFEGDTLITQNNVHHPNKTYRTVDLVSGRPYRFSLLMVDRHGDAGCTLHWEEPTLSLQWEAVQLARWADHVVLVMGLTARLEGEEMSGLQLDGFSAGDRTSLSLPQVQQRLIRQMAATGKPVTLVLMSGSAISINWENEHIPAILQSWYGGEAAGTAVADVIFGKTNPAGRLPVTWYRSVDDLPAFGDYNMEGRTYRFFEGEVLYPFGYGLSYTTFDYSNLLLEKREISSGETITVSVEVTNSGELAGEEVVQLYLRSVEPHAGRPLKELKGFDRVHIGKGQTIVVTMPLGPEELSVYDPGSGDYVVQPGHYEVMAGPSSDEATLLKTRLMVR